MRKSAPIAAACLSVLAVAGPALGAGTTTTTLQDDFFTRSKLTVSKGTTVVWKWNTNEKHSVTDRNRRFSSVRTMHGDYRHRYRRSGTFRVFCKVHPATMRQTIVVK